MFSPVALFVFALVLAELFVIVQLAGAIGVLTTLLLLVLTSMVGSMLIRARGAGFLRSSMQRVAEGDGVDTNALTDHALVLAGAFLLILPGFVTGTLGLALMIPPIRHLIRPVIRTKVASSTFVTSVRSRSSFGRMGFDPRSGHGVVIDTDVIDTDADTNPTDTNPTDTDGPQADPHSHAARPELS